MVEKSLASPFVMDTFNIQRVGNNVNLSWNTAIDTTTRKFVVERSTDGINFQKVGDSISPVSSQYTENGYQFTDVSAGDTLYYRLQMINKDGGIQYSSVLSLQGNTVVTGAWANPGSDWAYNFSAGSSATLSASGISSSTDASPFLPPPPTGISHAYIANGSAASFTLDATANNLTMVGGSPGNAKFSVYNIAGATSVVANTFNITFNQTGSIANNTAIVWSIGNTGTSGSLYTNSNAVYTASNSNQSLFSALRWLYSSSKSAWILSYRQGVNGSVQNYIQLSGDNFLPGIKYNVNIFANNSSSPQQYNFNGSAYSVAAQSLQVWVTNTSNNLTAVYYVSGQDFNLPASVETNSTPGDESIPVNTPLNSFLFQGSSNSTHVADIVLDGGIEMAYGALSDLPVSFVSSSFKATETGGTVKLNWTTASEQNNAYFKILRSPDAKSFIEIGKLAGYLTSSIPHDYSFIDVHPLEGNNYYKLQQVDIDGKVSYNSAVILINEKLQTGSLKVFVVDKQIRVSAYSVATGNAALEIYSASGQKISQRNIFLNPGINHFLINIPSLRKGIYIAVLRKKDVEETVPFLK